MCMPMRFTEKADTPFIQPGTYHFVPVMIKCPWLHLEANCHVQEAKVDAVCLSSTLCLCTCTYRSSCCGECACSCSGIVRTFVKVTPGFARNFLPAWLCCVCLSYRPVFDTKISSLKEARRERGPGKKRLSAQYDPQCLDLLPLSSHQPLTS